MSHQLRSEIKIAGGGISGLTSAILLAKAGYRVDVYEKRREIGGRFKGDLQGLENWTRETDVLTEIQSMGLGLDFTYNALPPLQLIDGRKMKMDFSFHKPLCYLVKRGTDTDSLDQSLKRQALQAGVQLHLNKLLPANEADIVATGPRSKQIFAVDLGIKFKTNHPDVAIALVNNTAAYKGYAYLLIMNGYGCLCTVLFDRFNTLKSSFEHAKKILMDHVALEIDGGKSVGGIGSFNTSLQFNDGDRLLLGEAAGIQDLLFGFGIRTAIRSGYLAAQSIMHHKSYTDHAIREFHHARKAGIVCRFMYETISRFKQGYPFLSKLVKNQSDPHWFLRNAYQYTPVHQLLYPVAKMAMIRRYPDLIV